MHSDVGPRIDLLQRKGLVLKRSHRILVSSLARNSARLCGQLVCTNEHRTLHSVHMAVHVDRGVVKYFTTPWSIESPVPRKVKITRSLIQ